MSVASRKRIFINLILVVIGGIAAPPQCAIPGRRTTHFRRNAPCASGGVLVEQVYLASPIEL